MWRVLLTAPVSFLDAVRQVVEGQIHRRPLGQVLQGLRLGGHYLGLQLACSGGAQSVVVQQIRIIVFSHLVNQSTSRG